MPAWLGALTRLQMLHLEECSGLTELPASLGALTGLQELDLFECKGLRELPTSLWGLTGLQRLNLAGCSGLHTPPPGIVKDGKACVLQFLLDIAAGALSKNSAYAARKNNSNQSQNTHMH